jgi:hypothetical protein
LRCYLCYNYYRNTETLFRHYASNHRTNTCKKECLLCPFCSQSVPFKSCSCHVITAHIAPREALQNGTIFPQGSPEKKGKKGKRGRNSDDDEDDDDEEEEDDDDEEEEEEDEEEEDEFDAMEADEEEEEDEGDADDSANKSGNDSVNKSVNGAKKAKLSN